jgi:hypothetical protein
LRFILKIKYAAMPFLKSWIRYKSVSLFSLIFFLTYEFDLHSTVIQFL